MITEKNFPTWLKKIRSENNWTQKELAALLEVSTRTIEGWERGKAPVKYLIPFLNLTKRLTKQIL